MRKAEKADPCEERRVSDEYPELFHYTTVSTLRRIVQSKELWATQATHLNDSTEMTRAWSWISRQLVPQLQAEFSKRSQADEDFKRRVDDAGGVSRVAQSEGKMLVDVMRSHLLGDDDTKGAAVPFVFSFANHGSDTAEGLYHQQHGMLSLWRGYGGQEGVAIVFDTKQIERLLECEASRFDYFSCYLATVVYESDDLSLEQEFPKLCDALGTYAQDWVRGNNDECIKSQERVTQELPTAAGRLKHTAFHEEEECRIVAARVSDSFRKECAEAGVSKCKLPKPIHHREGRRGSIPYIRLLDQLDHELPIKRVIVGPSHNQTAHEETTREILAGQSIKVQRSDTPFIGSV